jgi:hypothetical protein
MHSFIRINQIDDYLDIKKNIKKGFFSELYTN